MNPLLDALLRLESRGLRIAEDANDYRAELQRLTGHDPSKPITALDVVKIVAKVFAPTSNKELDEAMKFPAEFPIEP